MDDAQLFPEPSLTTEFVAMLVEEHIAHLNRHRYMTDFADASLVFAACECRLIEAEEIVHAGDECMDMLWDDIRAREA